MTRKGESLHIGVNLVDPAHYSGWSGPLNACEADAEDLRELAKSRGFHSRILLTKEATRKRVGDAIKEAADRLVGGDMFLLTYAGHGGQVPDEGGDEEDLTDETWCLYDGQMIDDEIRAFWSRFDAGVRIVVLSDSCHSGTVVREPVAAPDSQSLAELVGTTNVKYRYMPDDAAVRTYRSNKSFYDEIQRTLPKEAPEISATVRLLSGCQDDQVSLDGKFNGLFTGQLLRVWSSGSFEGNYRVFHDAIVSRMPASQTPNHLVIGAANEAFDAENVFQI